MATPEEKSAPPSSAEDTAPAAAQDVDAPNSRRSSPSVQLLTYFGTVNSASYATAKSQLAAGDLESALETISTALDATLSLTPDGDQLHESLGPLYYLYGTTLLRSAEESAEESADDPRAVMMVQLQQYAADRIAAAGGGAEGGAPAASADDDDDEPTDDLRVAWENLDTARTIVTRITSSSDFAAAGSSSSDSATATAPAGVESRAKVLDLGRIHLRLGDLQRANGNYDGALSDYSRALEIRTEALGTYDREVADAHYQMGVTYMYLMSAAEGEKEVGHNGTASAAAASASDGNETKKYTPEEIADFRIKSVTHYTQCGKSLGGLLAKLCGADPAEIVTVSSPASADKNENNTEDDDEDHDEEGGGSGKGKGKAKAPSSKSASSSEAANKPSSTAERALFATSSRTLETIRSRLSSLPPPDPTNQDAAADLFGLIGEIKETVDNSEADMGGIRDVSAMKAKAVQDAEAAADGMALKAGLDASKAGLQDGAGGGGGGGGTTTIGFGAPTVTATAATSTADTTVGFGTASACKPMMVVKKKKKKAAKRVEPTPAPAAAAAAAGGEDQEKDKEGNAAPGAKRQKTE